MTRTQRMSQMCARLIVCGLAALLACRWVPTSARALSLEPAPLPTISCPIVSGGTVIIAYGPQNLTRMAAYDAKTGHLLWDKAFSSVTFSDELVEGGGLLYANTWHSGIYVIAARDGKVKARLPEPHGTNAVACTSKRLYLSRWLYNSHKNSAVLALDPRTSRQVWERTFGDKDIWSVAADGDTIVVIFSHTTPAGFWLDERMVLAAADGRIISKGPIEIKTGDIIPVSSTLKLTTAERIRLSKALGKVVTIADNFQWRVYNTRIVQLDHFFFVGTWDYSTRRGAVFAIDLHTGRVAWKRPAQGIRDIAVAGGRVFVTYGEPYRRYYEPLTPAQQRTKALMALDARTGRVLWQVKVGAGKRAKG